MSKKNITGEDGKQYTIKEKKPFYKRWWFIVLVLIIAFGAITTVGEDETDAGPAKVDGDTEVVAEDNDDEKDNDEEEIENTEFSVGEQVEFEGQIVEITDVQFSSGEDFDTPAEGNEYVIVHIKIENQSDEKISYNPYNFSMENSNGQIENQTFTIIDTDTALSSGELREGGNVEGTLVFEQPIDDDGLKLIFEPSFWSTDEVIFNLQ